MLIFINVYNVASMEFNLLSNCQIMRHCPYLVVNFRDHKCYIVDKETIKPLLLVRRIMGYLDLLTLDKSRNMHWKPRVHHTSIHFGISDMGTST